MLNAALSHFGGKEHLNTLITLQITDDADRVEEDAAMVFSACCSSSGCVDINNFNLTVELGQPE